MKRINRRRFVAVSSVAATSAVLVACGNEPLSQEQLSPTQISDVPGAPPTLAPITATPGAESGASAPAPETGGGDSGGSGAPAAITIETHDDFSFSPNEVDVAPGQTITVTNAGFMQHDLVSDDLGIGTDLLNAGESADIVIPEDAKVGETFKFICTVPGHEQSGMVGNFTIVEASAAAPAESASDEAATPEEEAAAATGSAEAITIETHDDFSFSPNEVDVSPGQTITVTNAGFMQHDLVSKDLDIGTDLLNAGESEDIVIPEDATVGETYKFICTVAGHEQSGMVGNFTIVEAAAAPAPAGEEATAEEEATALESDGAAGSAEAITIKALDTFSFEPKNVEVSPGQTITVVNEGFMQHDLVSKDLGIGTDLLNNGETQDIVIPEDAAVGESYKFICTVAGHEQSGMIGSFTIVEGSGAAAPAVEATAVEEEAATPAATPIAATSLAVTVVGTKWEFSPAEFEIAPGGVITFQNDTDMAMGLSSETWDENTLTPMIKTVSPGKTGEFTVPEDAKVGDVIDFTSNLSEAEKQGMVGKITIVDAGAAGGAATPQASGGGQTIEVAMLDSFAFDPKDIECSVGDTLRFTNEGYMQHDAAVDDWSDEPLTPLMNHGETADVVIPDVAEVGQEYEYYCTVPGHKQSGMFGTIKII